MIAEASQAEWKDALERAREHAPFLARGLERLPELASRADAGDGEGVLAFARAAGDGIEDAGIALRREKLALAVGLALGDLAGAYPLDLVMRELSSFADRALDRAIASSLRARVLDAEPTGFIGLALGKQGACELNYSSDIDPILLYDPATLPRRERDGPGEAAQRYARDIVRLLSDNTAEGYVFRVDLRLRPASEASPLALSLNAALTHYESSALAWERAAFIRARASAGDIAAGEKFLASIRPFVWRRSLDFGAIDDVRRLTVRIRAGHDGPSEPGPGYSLKHGRGGIREIEFFAQTHQLIHGGRDPSLRVRGTRAALDALAAAGRIAPEDATMLGEAYDRLRTLEHRLQMVHDQQTHELPAGAALDNVARLDGLADGKALIEEVHALTDNVGRRFDALIDEDESADSSGRVAGSALSAQLGTLGFAEPELVARRIESWTDGRYRTLRSGSAREAFEAVLPALLEALSGTGGPERALLRWETMLASAPSAINLFRLLEARPALLDQLAHILSLAPPLADELGRRPDLLDTLIDRSALDLPGDADSLAARMRRTESDSYEKLLDRIRIVTGEVRFTLGVQLIEAAQDPLDIAAALSRNAEAALQVAVAATAEEFAKVHGTVSGGELLVLGLGRLGGGALTHASDLDIIYLFSGAHETESDGARPLGASLYFNRLAQRVTAALSVPTAEGALYDVDTRLRPQGNQGPIAASIDSFARYQAQDAWTWEHMALTRARVVAGSDAARRQVESVVRETLCRPRDPEKLREDVLAMRVQMAAHKPPRGPLDVKLARGGLVDLEFLIHYLQLRHSKAFEPLLAGAIALLVEEGLLPVALLPAERLLTRILVAARLLAPDLARPEAAAADALAAACGCESFEAVEAEAQQARRQIAAAWKAIMQEELEIVE